MRAYRLIFNVSLLLLSMPSALVWLGPVAHATERRVTIGGTTYTSYGLVGVGRVRADALDKKDETFGSGSGMAFIRNSWRRTEQGYEGSLLLLPDRGFNNKGGPPIDYRPRVNKLSIKFKPVAIGATPPAGRQQSAVEASIEETILLTYDNGQPFTGFDATTVRPPIDKLPALPRSSNGRLSLDPESIVRTADGTMYIGDEFGPYIYKFAASGELLTVISPPESFIPERDGEGKFSAEGKEPKRGRSNNRGFEGLALYGTRLLAMLQSPTVQDGGRDGKYTRAVIYDIVDPVRLLHEHVVKLPHFFDESGKKSFALQSEVLALGDTLFLMLCRDSNHGYGADLQTPSRFRWIGLLDISGASDIKDRLDVQKDSVLANGKLRSGITPARFVPFIDIDDKDDLQRFGLSNGENHPDSLSEKWESMGLVSALDPEHPDDFFLFVANDNDFITQRGLQGGVPYHHKSGVDVDTMFLVFRLSLPGVKLK